MSQSNCNPWHYKGDNFKQSFWIFWDFCGVAYTMEEWFLFWREFVETEHKLKLCIVLRQQHVETQPTAKKCLSVF